MKEATGELNLTVIVVIAVASLSAFFYTIIWPMIKSNTDQQTKCDSAYCDKCTSSFCETVTCHYKGENITCTWKG